MIIILLTIYFVGMVFTGILGAIGYKNDDEIQAYDIFDKIGVAIVLAGISIVWFITLPYAMLSKKKGKI